MRGSSLSLRAASAAASRCSREIVSKAIPSTVARGNASRAAACVWVTACVGAACAIAQWQIVVVGVVLVLVILVFGGPFEKAIDRRWPGRPSQVSDQPPDETRAPGVEMQKKSPS